MTAALVILASALAASVGGGVMLAVWLRTANEGRTENGDLAAQYKAQRDEYIGKLTIQLQRVGELERMLRETSAQRDDAVRLSIKAKAEEIRNAKTDADALAGLNSVLGQDLSKAGDSGAGRNGR